MMLISVSLNLLFLTLFIRSFSEFKNNKFVLPTYITVVLIQWYLNRNGMTFYGRWIILLLNLCYIMYMYKGKISKKLIYFIFVYFIFAISELVSVLLLEIFNVVSAPIDVHSSTYLIVILTTQIISYTIGFTLSKFYHDKNTIKFTYIVLIPIIFLLGIALCYKDYREILQKNQIFLNVFFFLTILIFISFLIQYGFIHNLQIKEELKLEKMENEFNAIKFDMMDRNYKSNFNFMHSLLHEITTLKSRIEKSENQTEYAQSIDAIEKIVLENFNQIYSNNIAMSVVLNEYKSKLENKHIKLSMNLPTDIFSNIKHDEQINLYLCLFDVLMITHSSLCKGYEGALKLILDIDDDDFGTLSFENAESLEDFSEKIKTMIDGVYKDRNLVVLLDLPGGSPANVSLPFINSSRKFIAGINLPFVLELMTMKKNGISWEELNIEEICENASRSMVFYNKLLDGGNV